MRQICVFHVVFVCMMEMVTVLLVYVSNGLGTRQWELLQKSFPLVLGDGVSESRCSLSGNVCWC